MCREVNQQLSDKNMKFVQATSDGGKVSKLGQAVEVPGLLWGAGG